MKSMKIAYIFVISIVLIAGMFIFFSFFGREMLANKFIESAIKSDGERAISYYNIALKLSPKNATARNNLIDIYIENDEVELALNSIETGLVENPDNDNLYFYKIKIYEQNSDIEQAVQTANNIESSYVKSKFSSKSNIEPSFNLQDGTYNENVEISIKTDENASIYYKINAEKYQVYQNPINLSDGFYNIYAVAINEQGLVSREVDIEIYVENLIAPVSFATSGTIQAIEKQIGTTDEINYDGLFGLTEIDLTGNVLFDADIETLLNCSNLETLKLGDISNISTIYPLTKLKNLHTLYIESGCTEKIFSEIIGMNNLKNLEVTNSKINYLPENKTFLTKLSLKNCLVYDITKISTYKTLEHLDLSQNLISDISGIENLKKLNYLNLSNNKISDISDIVSIISLKSLDISNNEIYNVRDISNLFFLETVNMSNNQIASVIEFANLRYLTTLNCSYNNILTLEPLISSKSLIEIYANDNFIGDFSYLYKIENLAYINVENNQTD